MKKLIVWSLLIPAFIASCDSKPRGDSATVTDEKSATASEGVTVYVDTMGSLVGFTGWGVGKNHPGRFKFNSGTMTVQNGELKSGTFEISIASLSMDEEGEAYDTKLRGHLLSKDFFEADVYPFAKFEITNVEPFTESGTDASVVAGANRKISGNLTLRGVTKNVTFPANVEVTDDQVKAKANFNIDRTQWNMHYNADKTSAQDKFIDPMVNIKLDIVGKR